jgi:hypothetical protein
VILAHCSHGSHGSQWLARQPRFRIGSHGLGTANHAVSHRQLPAHTGAEAELDFALDPRPALSFHHQPAGMLPPLPLPSFLWLRPASDVKIADGWQGVISLTMSTVAF